METLLQLNYNRIHPLIDVGVLSLDKIIRKVFLY